MFARHAEGGESATVPATVPRNMVHNLQMFTHDGGGRGTAPLGRLATNDL